MKVLALRTQQIGARVCAKMAVWAVTTAQNIGTAQSRLTWSGASEHGQRHSKPAKSYQRARHSCFQQGRGDGCRIPSQSCRRPKNGQSHDAQFLLKLLQKERKHRRRSPVGSRPKRFFDSWRGLIPKPQSRPILTLRFPVRPTNNHIVARHDMSST